MTPTDYCNVRIKRVVMMLTAGASTIEHVAMNSVALISRLKAQKLQHLKHITTIWQYITCVDVQHHKCYMYHC